MSCASLTVQAAYGLKVELRTLELLVQKKLPTVAAHLDKLDTTTSCITPTWFSNLFTTTLPAEVTARVFDCLLLEGNKVGVDPLTSTVDEGDSWCIYCCMSCASNLNNISPTLGLPGYWLQHTCTS